MSSCCFLRDEVDVQAAARRDEASFVPAAASVLSLLGRSKKSSRKRKEGFLRQFTWSEVQQNARAVRRLVEVAELDERH